ncbi:MAG: hypothetical protein AAB268_10495 [Elusimicrobiota bacterium]
MPYPTTATHPKGRPCLIWKDFRSKVERHFSPRKVAIEMFEDWSGIDWIKVYNENETFDLYDGHTHPSVMQIVSKVLGFDVENVELDPERWILIEKERSVFFDMILQEFNMPPDSCPVDWERLPHGRGAVRKWENWLDSHRPVYLTPGTNNHAPYKEPAKRRSSTSGS